MTNSLTESGITGVRRHAPEVLIVEDERRLRELLLDVIPTMGFQARAVRSAEEALESLRTHPADILLLDLHLPGMSGLELLDRLRARRAGEQVAEQVIIMTAYGDLESARRAIRAEVADFLTKPSPLGEIEAALERARRRWAATPAKVEEDAETSPAVPGQTLSEVERNQITAVLARHGGNRTATAAELGISRRTLHSRIAEYRRQGFNIE